MPTKQDAVEASGQVEIMFRELSDLMREPLPRMSDGDDAHQGTMQNR